MLERPDGADLLATAREVVLSDLLPALPAEKAFHARMVAAAIALALRERGTGTADVEAALQDISPDLATLATAIRAGTHDPGTPTHEAVAAFLREYARLRARVSAPKALA